MVLRIAYADYPVNNGVEMNKLVLEYISQRHYF